MGLAGSAAAAIVAVPALGAIAYPLRTKTIREEEGFIDVSALADLNGGAPVRASVLATRWDGWSRNTGVELGTVWLRKQDDGSVVAFSSVCPHLGCSVDYLPDSRTYNCPCHGSVFDLEGKVIGGPSPRALDKLPCTVAAGRVQVKYERFVVGERTQRPA